MVKTQYDRQSTQTNLSSKYKENKKKDLFNIFMCHI